MAAGRLGAVLLVELAVLTEVNNAVGHDRGSQLLADAGSRLSAVAGPGRPVGRIEMDRFAVLFDQESEAEIVAGRPPNLLAAASRQYQMGDIEIDPEAVAGVALVQAEDPNAVDPSAAAAAGRDGHAGHQRFGQVRQRAPGLPAEHG